MKILPTIGPATKSKDSIKYISKICSIVRLNTSHNKIEWHKQIIKTIKNINKNIDILVDIPGVKPRTNNLTDIHIKKNQVVKFGYNLKKSLNVINLTKKLPKKNKNVSKFFTIDDGKIKFKLLSYKKNIIIGRAYEDCIIKPRKGVNIPNSLYDDNSQIKIYENYINQLSEKNLDAVGLSFIQNKNAIIKLKKKFKKLLMVSKVENTEGLNNVEEICKHSDAIMIDRGDLSAEIGERNLYEAIIKISETAKKFGKPLIMATENLESMFQNKEPSKNDIISLEFSNQINSDIIMLSEETAISNRWKEILNWLNTFIKNKKKISKKRNNEDLFWKKVENIKDHSLVVFTKKGLMLDKIFNKNIKNDVFVFTDTIKTKTLSNFYKNAKCFLIDRFDNKNISKFYFKNIKKYKKIIFQKSNNVFLISISFPKKGSKANSLSLINKNDF
jgi:pyruvate kinase